MRADRRGKARLLAACVFGLLLQQSAVIGVAKSDKTSLQGVKTIRVDIIMPTDDEANRAINVSAEALRVDVELRLRKAGITIQSEPRPDGILEATLTAV